MKLIDLEGRKPVIDPAALVIKEFKTIWVRDKTKDKAQALREITYIYFQTDYMSPYRNYIGAERINKIKEAVQLDPAWEPDKEVQAAIERYKSLQITPSLGLLEDAETAVQKLRGYFRDTDITRSRDGSAAKNLIMNLKQLGDIVKSLKALRDLVEHEQYEATAIRGGGRLGMRELPKHQR